MNSDLVDICCENLYFGIYRRYCCKVFKGTTDDHEYSMNKDDASFHFRIRMFGLIHNSNEIIKSILRTFCVSVEYFSQNIRYKV